jgi:hypothetical protein
MLFARRRELHRLAAEAIKRYFPDGSKNSPLRWDIGMKADAAGQFLSGTSGRTFSHLCQCGSHCFLRIGDWANHALSRWAIS